MKKSTLILVLTVSFLLAGAYLKDIPVSIKQPDGTAIECFSTGDEFFNRLHDAEGYTIIQASDGWYYYGVRSGDDVIPSGYRADFSDPFKEGLEKNAVISGELYRKRVENFNNYPKIKDAPTTGTINNLVIFIRFADEEETIFNSQRSYYDDYFNKADGPSLQHYFDEVSYQQLEVNSSYYPHLDDFTTNLSYQDIYDRNYFKPYNQTANPEGYINEGQRTTREHELLKRAVEAIADEIPQDLDIDGDRDGNVDNIVFLISGAPGEWASLLWPHRWVLYSENVVINRKRVYDYNFDLTGTTTYFTVGVICHEFFHTLGAPDLYHYYDDTAPDAVGAWDVMNSTSNPPQYMGAWMKYKYGDWITEVPVINQPGEYILNPLQSPTGNIYRINSPESNNEFFVLEYRKQSGLYETRLPGSDDGILIYRINSSYDGNANGPPDEVYVFRPNGTIDTSGQINNAIFSESTGRTEFNLLSNPAPFLSDGSPGGINIINIGTAGETITFSIGLNVNPPTDLITASNYGYIELNWSEPETVDGADVEYYRIYRGGSMIADNVLSRTYNDEDVISGETYTYTITAYYTGGITGESTHCSENTVYYTGPIEMPFSTDMSVDAGMEEIYINTDSVWKIQNSSNAGGISPEIKAYKELQENATAYYITPPLSVNGIDTLTISFRHSYLSYDPTDISFSVVISDDKYSWQETGWGYQGDANYGPEQVEIALTEFPDPLYVGWKLDGILWNTDGWFLDDISILTKEVTGINEAILPETTELYGNYPNPFNPETTVHFSLQRDSEMQLSIYDMKGSLVRTLYTGEMKAGYHRINWNGKDNSGNILSTGLYYINMKTGEKNFTTKSLMIK